MPYRRAVVARAALVAALAAGALDARAQAPAVPEPPAIPARLDLDTALRLARERGLDVLLAEAAVAGARGDLEAAGAVANPTVSLGYGRSTPFGRCTDATGASVACRPLPDAALSASLSDGGAVADALAGKRGLRTAVARRALEAARLSRDDAIRVLEGAVKAQFASTALARAALDFSREAASAADRTLALTRAREQAGAISEADVARVETQKLEADQAVDGAQAALAAARIGLATLLGARGEIPAFQVEPGGLDRVTVPPALAAADRAALVARALADRPDLRAAERQVAQSEAALALARRMRVPDVSLSLSYAQQGTTNAAVSPPTWTVGVALPLPVFYRQQGEIARAEADAAARRLALAQAQASATADVEGAWAAYQAARSQAERMQGRLLERAHTALDLVTVQYEKGAASLLDLLDAQRTWIGVRSEYFQDVEAYWTAVFRLEQAAGVSLR